MEGDGLPGQVCLQCVHYISRAFSFKQLCERSDATLRQYLGKPLLTDLTVKEPLPQPITQPSDETKDGILEPKIEILENEGINSKCGINYNIFNISTNIQLILKMMAMQIVRMEVKMN